MSTMVELESKNRDELEAMAKECGIIGYSALKKSELVHRILQVEAEEQGNVFVTGVLETISEGYGFLRQDTFQRGANDVYVSNSQIRRFNLRDGDAVHGQARPPKESEKYYGLLRVEGINGLDPELARTRRNFASLTPIFPDKLINLETTSNELSTRLINLVAPIGRGQRGLIVSPPKAGKTVLLQKIANSIITNYNDIHLMVCLIGERPEEVTDMKKSVKAEVVAATFDEPVESQTRVAELALERAKRLVEMGKDVVILLDGITRLTRAYNLALPPSGRTLSGGIDSIALHPPKRFFGTARNTDADGSLTIIATCLVDTGSRMDDLIYEEFKGTGNMELHLDRKLAERRIFPAINIMPSSTRREELLLDENTLKQVWLLRRIISMIGSDSPNHGEATQRILERLAKTKDNAEFLATLSKDI
ncbi:MAG TPA: transcription termination factor Rho [Dehalococcoidia bacterium]|nr:transcription termination factor Rho [Dehalococcoidia bacterium]